MQSSPPKFARNFNSQLTSVSRRSPTAASDFYRNKRQHKSFTFTHSMMVASMRSLKLLEIETESSSNDTLLCLDKKKRRISSCSQSAIQVEEKQSVGKTVKGRMVLIIDLFKQTSPRVKQQQMANLSISMVFRDIT